MPIIIEKINIRIRKLTRVLFTNMKTTFASLASLALMSSTGLAALDPLGPTWLEGSCPKKGQNKEDLNLYKMAGLWFEYVWEDHMGTDMDHYVCSSFIWLDEGNGEFIVYNSFQFPAEEELWALEKR